MKTSQDFDRFAHRLGRKKVGTEHPFAQSGHFSIFMNGLEFPPAETGYFETNRVGTDVNGCEDGHEQLKLMTSFY